MVDFFSSRGQGSLEYLLIIGGGILVAIVIIGTLIPLTTTGSSGSRMNIAETTCNTYTVDSLCISADLKIIDITGGCFTDCCWDGGLTPGKQCYLNPTAFVEGSSGQTGGSTCNNGTCDVGETCPVDSSDCPEPTVCYFEPRCVNGSCTETQIMDGEQDTFGTNLCDDTTGCASPPCACQSGSCAEYVEPPAELTACGFAEWQSGQTYVLQEGGITNAVATTCFAVDAPNVTIDCIDSSRPISLSDDAAVVIDISADNVTIQNCTINTTGLAPISIHIAAGNGSLISNCSLSGGITGVNVSAGNTTIEHTNINTVGSTNPFRAAIRAYCNCSGISVHDNSISGTQHGVLFAAGTSTVTNSTVSNNILTYSGGGGSVAITVGSTIANVSTNNIISNNVITSNTTGPPIKINTNGNTVSGNQIIFTGNTYAMVINGLNNFISNNSVTQDGAYAAINIGSNGSNNTLISNNVCGGTNQTITIESTTPQNASSQDNTCGTGQCTDASGGTEICSVTNDCDFSC